MTDVFATQDEDLVETASLCSSSSMDEQRLYLPGFLTQDRHLINHGNNPNTRRRTSQTSEEASLDAHSFQIQGQSTDPKLLEHSISSLELHLQTQMEKASVVGSANSSQYEYLAKTVTDLVVEDLLNSGKWRDKDFQSSLGSKLNDETFVRHLRQTASRLSSLQNTDESISLVLCTPERSCASSVTGFEDSSSRTSWDDSFSSSGLSAFPHHTKRKTHVRPLFFRTPIRKVSERTERTELNDTSHGTLVSDSDDEFSEASMNDDPAFLLWRDISERLETKLREEAGAMGTEDMTDKDITVRGKQPFTSSECDYDIEKKRDLSDDMGQAIASTDGSTRGDDNQITEEDFLANVKLGFDKFLESLGWKDGQKGPKKQADSIITNSGDDNTTTTGATFFGDDDWDDESSRNGEASSPFEAIQVAWEELFNPKSAACRDRSTTSVAGHYEVPSWLQLLSAFLAGFVVALLLL